MLHKMERSDSNYALLEKYLNSRSRMTTEEVGIAQSSSDTLIPLSVEQERFWLLEQRAPGTSLYTTCAALHLPGSLDIAALEKSLNEIIKRHEVWRTNFAFIDERPVQVIRPAWTITLPIIDLRHLPEAEREDEALRLAKEDAQIPFDLAQGPLLRAKLIQLADREHRLFLTMHQTIADDIALCQILPEELWLLYEAFSNGQPSPLPALPFQYADFARWQRERLRSDTVAEHLAYWKQQLADAPSLLELPTDRPRPPLPSHRGSTYPFALPRRLAGNLKALSRDEGVTLDMVLVAAFQALLYRYTGQDDIVIGTNTADRKRPEFQMLLGSFLNPLAVRSSLADNPTFRELLRRVRKGTFAALAHDEAPFAYVVRELQPEREAGQYPFFQAMLTLKPASPVLPSGWSMTWWEVEKTTAMFDLSLELDDRPDGLLCRFEYSTDLFDRSTISRFAGHWQTILESIVADPEQQVAQLPFLTGAEQQQLLVEWNATQRAYPVDRCVHQLFEDQVEQTPDAVAAVFEGEQLTYRELNHRANQLAHYLQSLGVGPEVLVAICLERSLNMLVGLLGILKAGCAYVPLDPTYPAERLAFMLEDAQVSVLLTQRDLLARLPAHSGPVVCLDGNEEDLTGQCTANPASTVRSENLAYVIYTSGSTGKPKGVQILHRAVVNFLHSMRRQPGICAEDTLLAVTTLSFDIAALELFLPLIVGARVIIASRDVVLNPMVLAKTLTHSEATLMQATPVTWRVLLESGWQGNPRLKALCGGEALPLELAQQLLAKVGSLYNMYGPTETTIWSSVYEIKLDHRTISIGRPIANTQMYLLDQHLQLVPIGIPGELYIGGDGLARGYLKRPELTAERFINHPFSSAPGARIYKTGDLARYRPDGTIELIGRIDHQVKIRGFRIEPGEIEQVLRLHPAVQEAVVIAREDTPGDKRLVAYLLPRNEQAITGSDLRNHLLQHVPSYMVPSAFVSLKAFPLTPNGKVDRKALPPPQYGSAGQVRNCEAPRTAMEEQLAAIWSQVLGVEKIGIHDNFFTLGGHSLLAMQVMAQILDTLHRQVPMYVLFEMPTIAQLAQYLREQSDNSADLAAIQRVPRHLYRRPVHALLQAGPGESYADASQVVVIPATTLQQSLWLADQSDPSGAAYNLFVTMRLNARLNVAALEQSIQTLVERHETLRTTFTLFDGQLMQVIAPQMTIPVAVVDVQSLPRARREAEVQRLLRQQVQEPFDLAHGPLLRVLVVLQEPEDALLLLVMHHIISDGWSIDVLNQELTGLYQAYNTGQPATLRELPIQYADFALWQRQQEQQDRLAAHLEYWKRQLAGAPPVLELPTDRPRPTIASHQGATYRFTLSRSLTEKLRSLSRQEGVTLYITLLAAFQAQLARYSGQEDLVVGSVSAGRERAETRELIGYFVQTLVLRTDLSGQPTARQLLERVRVVVLEAQAHQQVPFEQVVRELHPQRSLSHHPLFQVMLTLDPPALDVAAPWQTIQMDLETGACKFDLSLELAEQAEEVRATLEYSTDLFEESTVARMMAHWQNLLQGMADHPERPVSQLSLLSPAERQQMLVDWNREQVALPQQSLANLFEQQVERTPNAIALLEEQQQLTYRQLNERANQLAHYLQQSGVGPNVFVGVCLQRSLQVVISLLAILKAGGVYVPLDPSYPTERLTFLLQDTRMPLLLTQESLLNRLPRQADEQRQLVCLDRNGQMLAQQRTSNPLHQGHLDALAYVIYTSGSTGQPKGVLVSQQALAAHCCIMRQVYGLKEHDRVLQFSTFTFDVSLEQMLPPLLAGASVVVRGPELWTPAELLEQIHHRRLTVLSLTPAYWQQVLREWVHTPERLKGHRLRLVIVGGDRFSPEILHLWRHLPLQEVRLLNAYGPTEAVITATIHQVAVEQEEAGNIPIGRPLPNRTVYLLDQQGHPVPIGVTGELYLGGHLLARGYLNQPELTAERFVADPFGGSGCIHPAARLYKTGDLARYRADGTLEFVGRTDQQVKVRGFRIEVGEIEAILRRHPAVQEAVVVAREDALGEQTLLAYVVAAPGVSLQSATLRRYLQERLPEYMLPAAFVPLERLPLLPTGKLDRRALPDPEESQEQPAEKLASPSTPLETTIAEIWSQVLGVEPISIHDDFFLLGGHSLLAMQLISRLHTALQVDLSLRNLFEAPTVAQLARFIRQLQDTETTDRLPSAIEPVAREQYLVPVSSLPLARREDWPPEVAVMPATWNQQSLWLVDQMEPDSPAYNVPILLQFNERLQLGALEQSIQALVERHETLRTTFILLNGQLMQVIAPAMKVTLPVADVQDLPQEQREAQVQMLIAQQMQQPFDLARGPLLRALVIQKGPEDYLLLLVMHHIISDGWSAGALSQDVTRLYEAYSTGQSASLPELPIQYADYALWQRQQEQQDRLAAHLEYWKQHLADAPPILELPTDHPRPSVSTHRGKVYTFALPRRLTEELKQLSHQEGVTLYITLLAAFQALLARYSGQEDLVVGSVSAGRERAETRELIGYFVQTFALRCDLSGQPTVRQWLERVREIVLEAQAHQQVPFEQVVRELHPQRSLRHHPLFQVMLTLDPPLPPLASQWEYSQLAIETGACKFDLSLELTDHPEGVRGALEYSMDLFEESTIARMMAHWQKLLQGMVADPQQSVAALPLLSEQERQQILVAWNHEQVALPRQSLADLFEQQVERTPNAVALREEDRQLTYRQLNERANQLAHYLQQLGVDPNALVGVCLQRSLQVVISLLAILKAGGAYVPLDPGYPTERLRFLLQDTRMPLLLTERHLLTRLPRQQARLLCLDGEQEAIQQQRTSNPLRQEHLDALAYVIYTSGSTGQPKGVLVSQQALAAHCRNMQQAYELKQEDRVLQFSAFTFDASLEQMLPPLLAGACVVVRGPELWSPMQLLDQIHRQGLTVINLPPAYWQQVLREWVHTPERLAGHRLRLVIVGGDRLAGEAVALWRHLPLQEVRLLNAYGPTEAVITATLYQVSAQDEEQGSVPIGRPLPNRRLYLLDQQGHPVPIGVTGELYLGGHLLARGYLNQPELTAERFVADPFVPAARLYKTGDLARYRADGTVEFVGRRDQQVKVRGFRIEVGEIEAALLSHPAVREAVVVAREDSSGEQALAAYVVAGPGKAVQEATLRQYLQEWLPEYMLPATFVPLERLPLLPTGKLDRRALPEPKLARIKEEETFVAPKRLIHQQLVQIWEELLDVRPIGIKDNFFYLGGHSLLAAHLVDRIEHDLGKRISLSTLFSGPTIEQLADALEQQERVDTRTPLLPVQAGGSKRPFFFLHGDWTGGAFYCFTLARALGDDQPFYVLEPYRFESLQTFPSFEEVAAAHIESMRAVQPKGPYLLGGFCNGGLLAYEMARQLEAAGERVDFLGLINPSVPVQFKAVRTLGKRMSKSLRLGANTQANLFLRIRHAARHVYRHLYPASSRVQDFDQLLAIDPRLKAMFPPVDALHNDYVGAFSWLVSQYETGTYGGKITFYWASEEPGIEDTWLPITRTKDSKDVENHVVEGTHMSCVTEHIHDLAQCLSACVRRVQEENIE